MGFFDNLPPPGSDEPRPADGPWHRRETEFARVAASGLLLGRTDDDAAYSFGGGHHHRERSYWVWPLPPPGPVTFVLRWTARGIPESRAEVDGQLIRDAAEHSIRLWPAASGQPPEGS